MYAYWWTHHAARDNWTIIEYLEVIPFTLGNLHGMHKFTKLSSLYLQFVEEKVAVYLFMDSSLYVLEVK